MQAQKFSKGEAIRFGWEKMKSNLGFFIILLTLVALISIVPDLVVELIKKDAPIVSVIISLASWFLSMLISMGLIRIVLKLHDNEKGEFDDLFSCYPLFFKYLIGSILYSLIVLAGLILLIIPGIIFAVKFFFFDYFIVDKNAGPIEALKKSSEITKGVKLNLYLFLILIALINLLGVLCLLVGLFLTLPTTMMATVFIYRKLAAQEKIVQATEKT